MVAVPDRTGGACASAAQRPGPGSIAVAPSGRGPSRQQRREIEAKEAQLRDFAENIPGPIAVVDRDFRYVFANKIFQESRGLELESVVAELAVDACETDVRNLVETAQRIHQFLADKRGGHFALA